MSDTHFLTAVIVYYFAKLTFMVPTGQQLPQSCWQPNINIPSAILLSFKVPQSLLYLHGLGFRRPYTMNHPEP